MKLTNWNNNGFHSAVTVSLGELVESGVIDWSDPSWKWDAYSDEQYQRVTEKINARFWYRDISLVPPGVWKREFLRKMNELAPKYALLYKSLEQGFDPLQTNNNYGKSREIYSDFPQTQLSGNSDYATNGRDREFENVTQGDAVEKIKDFAKNYQDVDVLLLDEIEELFSCLYALNINGL